jgi:hypothetical protein
MPVTRSELLFLCGGAVAGAIVAKNFDKIKTRVAPFLATAGEAASNAYTAAARQVAERLEAVQDAMAETHGGAGQAGAEARPDPGPSAATANGTQG